MKDPAPPPQRAPAVGGLAPQINEWLDLPPPRLTDGDIEAMEDSFLRLYPGEKLDPDTTPCPRYLSTVP